MSRNNLKEWLDSQEFYELMQAYRCAPMMPQGPVIEAFEDVKAKVLEQHEKNVKFLDDQLQMSRNELTSFCVELGNIFNGTDPRLKHK